MKHPTPPPRSWWSPRPPSTHPPYGAVHLHLTVNAGLTAASPDASANCYELWSFTTGASYYEGVGAKKDGSSCAWNLGRVRRLWPSGWIHCGVEDTYPFQNR